MARATYVPVTPSVLSWAIDESGYTLPDLASRIPGADGDTITRWLEHQQQPTLTQFRALAKALKRPSATFLLSKPPTVVGVSVQFRHPLSPEARVDLSPVERRYLREAKRLQRALAWIRRKLDERPAAFPLFSVESDEPERVARTTRELLGVPIEEQHGWTGPSEALREWRAALEGLSILVFSFPMGEESCRGFSIWSQNAPLVAVNSAWRPEARIFTLFHEVGHLLTRTNSACLEVNGSRQRSLLEDPAERWCERFAAAVLLPRAAVLTFLQQRFGWQQDQQIVSLNQVSAIARRFRTSVRATTIRLIELSLANWDLYRQIQPASEKKSGGGGPTDDPRTRPRVRLDEYGEVAVDLFFRAVDKDILDSVDIASYLDLADTELPQLRDRLDR